MEAIKLAYSDDGGTGNISDSSSVNSKFVSNNESDSSSSSISNDQKVSPSKSSDDGGTGNISDSSSVNSKFVSSSESDSSSSSISNDQKVSPSKSSEDSEMHSYSKYWKSDCSVSNDQKVSPSTPSEDSEMPCCSKYCESASSVSNAQKVSPSKSSENNEMPSCSKYCDQASTAEIGKKQSTEHTNNRSDFFNFAMDTEEQQQDSPTFDRLQSESADLHDIEYGPSLKTFDDLFCKRKDYFTSLGKQITAADRKVVANFKPEPLDDEGFSTKESVQLGKVLMYRHCIDVKNDKKSRNYFPIKIAKNYNAHSSMISSLEWCIPQYSHLFLSASADGNLKIWDLYAQHPLISLRKDLGLKAAKWNLDGRQVVFGGYAKKVYVHDVLSGKSIRFYDVRSNLTSVCVHPYMESVILCGTKNAILAFDLREENKQPIKCFYSKCQEVLDIAFLDKNEFAICTNFVSQDSADRTIMVWDFPSGAILSNQIYLERYTCPSLKVNPITSSFVAQTNGDYIAAFSSKRPYVMKNRKYMGHQVSGYGIEIDVSPDGYYVASGDANGDLYFYDYFEGHFRKKLTVKPDVVTNRLKWHPVLRSTMIVSTWDGKIYVCY